MSVAVSTLSLFTSWQVAFFNVDVHDDHRPDIMAGHSGTQAAATDDAVLTEP